MNDFEKWVASLGGANQLAKRLEIPRATVGMWLMKKNYPRVDTMREIIKLSEGEMTYDKIIIGCTPTKAAHKKKGISL